MKPKFVHVWDDSVSWPIMLSEPAAPGFLSKLSGRHLFPFDHSEPRVVSGSCGAVTLS